MGHELSMYFWGVSCIYDWDSTWNMRHIILWCHVALHLITSFIFVDYGFYCGWKVRDIWFSLFDGTWLVILYRLVYIKNRFSYINSCHYFFVVVQDIYWVHVISYSYYTCCTLLLCRLDFEFRHVLGACIWVWIILELWCTAWDILRPTPSIYLYLLGYFGILIGYFLCFDFHISLDLYPIVEALVLMTLNLGVVFLFFSLTFF